MKIKKMLGHKTLWCTYTATSSRERDEVGQELEKHSSVPNELKKQNVASGGATHKGGGAKAPPKF